MQARATNGAGRFVSQFQATMDNIAHQSIWLTGDRGSGKSAWICDRYIQLAKAGVPLNKILLLTVDEPMARVLSWRILKDLRGIWGSRIQSVGGFLADYVREVLARKAHPAYPLRLASQWRLYNWLKDRLATSERILARYYLSLFADWRKWHLEPALLSKISLAEYSTSQWRELVSIYGEFCSYFEEERLSDLAGLAHLFINETDDKRFLPSHLLVDDAHEFNAATWPIVTRLSQRAKFALAMLPKGKLFEEVDNVGLASVRDLAREETLGSIDPQPRTVADKLMPFLQDTLERSTVSWTLLQAASPLEELLQGLLWARDRSNSARVVIYLALPASQIELLLEAAAWLETKLSLQGGFRSDWFPSLTKLVPSSSTDYSEQDDDKPLPARLCLSSLFRRFAKEFERACEGTIAFDVSCPPPAFREALDRGLLKVEFPSNLRLPHGIEVATFDRPDLAVGAHVWMVGLAREAVPDKLPRSPVFSREAAEELQRKLAASGYPVKLELTRPMLSYVHDSQRRFLDILTRSRQDVLLSYATRSSSDQPTAESPFFRSLVAIARAQKDSTHASIRIVNSIYPVSLWKRVSRAEKKLPALPKRHLVPFPLSATALAEFIACPRRFFYEQVLELEVPERSPALIVGSLLHEAVARLLAPSVETEPPTGAALAEWIHDLCDKSDQFRDVPEGSRPAIEQFLTRVLDDFFESPDVWQGMIEDVERVFQFPVADDLVLKGRIDRIDFTTDGSEVIDYKSAKSFGARKLKSEFLKAADWIQLPIYIKAAETLRGRPVTKASIIFFGLRTGDEPKRATIRIATELSAESEGKSQHNFLTFAEIGEVWGRVIQVAKSIFSEDQQFGRGEKPPCEKFSHGCPFIRICPVAQITDENTAENDT
jgi:RecB family exonuclease